LGESPGDQNVTYLIDVSTLYRDLHSCYVELLRGGDAQQGPPKSHGLALRGLMAALLFLRIRDVYWGQSS